jgi:hypothetical protein
VSLLASAQVALLWLDLPWTLSTHCRKPSICLPADLLDQQLHGAADECRDDGIGIGQDTADLLHAVTTASRNGNAGLPAESAPGIDARSAGAHPQGAGAMQSLQRLLFSGFELDRRDVGTEGGFEQGTGSGAVGKNAPNVSAATSNVNQFAMLPDSSLEMPDQ